jgi:hypothetical protein
MTPSKKRLVLFLLIIFLFMGLLFAQPANNNCAKLKINLQGITAGSYYLKVEGTCIDLKTRFQKQY